MIRDGAREQDLVGDTASLSSAPAPPLCLGLHVLTYLAFRMAMGAVVAVTGATGKQGASRIAMLGGISVYRVNSIPSMRPKGNKYS